MPITSSAKKALRQNIARKAENTKQRNALKRAIKDFKKTLAAGDAQKAADLLTKVYKTLDKAAKRGVINRGTADRLKSRLTKKLPR